MSSRERLQAVIDAHGADPRRWPESGRTVLEALAQAPEVKRALAEAHALDAVLAQSAAPEPASLASLQSRIIAAAAVRRAPVRAIASDKTISLGERRSRATSRLRGAWPAAAALAASLLIGAFLGASELGQPAVESLIASAGFDTSDQLMLDPLGVGDEELL